MIICEIAAEAGYNVQIGVDSEYIVAAGIFQDRNDTWTLIPMLKEMKYHHNWKYSCVTADSGYESEESYEYLKKNKQVPYIKPPTYEQWKKRSFKNNISKRENMTYDPEHDTYTCHAGKLLTARYVKKSPRPLRLTGLSVILAGRKTASEKYRQKP